MNIALVATVLILGLISLAYGQTLDNQNQEQIQFNNIIKRFQERLGLTNMQDIQNLQDQYQSQNNKDPDDITVYLCVQVDKNSTQRVCKYWNNDELRPVMLKIMSEDDELNNLLRQIMQDSFNKAFNKSQNYSSEK